MSALRVLVLGSYPTLHPRHGGQIRLSQVIAAYRGRGFDVHTASFFQADPFYTGLPLGPLDVALPIEQLQHWRGRHAPFMEDMTSGEMGAGDDRRLEAIERQVRHADVVHLEQPWLLPVVRRLRERRRLGDFRLVYGSQNIEHGLKRAILEQHGVRDPQDLAQAVETLERDAAREADWVAAVTPEDAHVLSGWTRAPVVPPPTGFARCTCPVAARLRWRERLGPRPFALYVASAHQPNIVGLGESFGPSLACLSPVHKLVLAGHAGQFIVDTPWFKRWKELNQRRVEQVGVLSLEDLSALRDLAHTFILPVTSGGGSNLKTAEALYAGRRVVATPLAMRGFEALADLAGLRVAEPGPAFGQAVAHSLDAPPLPSDPAAQARRESLTWNHTLAALCDALTSSRRESA